MMKMTYRAEYLPGTHVWTVKVDLEISPNNFYSGVGVERDLSAARVAAERSLHSCVEYFAHQNLKEARK